MPSENRLRQSGRVVLALEQERFQRGQEGEFGDTLVAVGLDVAGKFAGAHGEADQDHLAQVEGLQQRVEVGGEGVVVVADTDLAGPAEPAAVVGDDAESGGDQLTGL
jgi:hypothetical protein